MKAHVPIVCRTGHVQPKEACNSPVRDGPPVASVRRRLVGWAKRALLALAIAGSAALIVAAALVRRVAANLPSTAELRNYRPPASDAHPRARWDATWRAFTERRTLVGFHDIPNQVKVAVLAAEDASFSEHGGLNYLGILRALAKNVGSGPGAAGGGDHHSAGRKERPALA